MCLGSPVTWTSSVQDVTLTSRRNVYQTSQSRLRSLHVSGIPLTWTSTPVGTSTSDQPVHTGGETWGPYMCLGSPVIPLSVLFLTGSETSVVPTRVWVPHHTNLHPLRVSGIPGHKDLHPGRNVYLTSWFIFLCWFWQVMRCLWSVHVSGIPHHTDLRPSRNVCLTSWFILSVLFLTDGETSVDPTSFRDPPSHGPPSQ